jgi:signal transduction histidine kinase
MSGWLAHLSFRARLTLWWTLAFGFVLTAATFAIYTTFRASIYADFDTNVRTVAATELASSTDGPGIHLHQFPREALAGEQVSDKFVQILEADGRLRLSSPALDGVAPLVSSDVVADALAGRAPLVSADVHGRPARIVALTTHMGDARYVVVVGMFRDPVDALISRLGWILGLVWFVAIGVTTAVGYVLASRALSPIVGITQRASRIAQGEFSARLDAPSSEDEVGEMTRSLNHVLERLHGSLEANRTFAADASHELRAPLAAMAGAVDVTLKRPRSEQEYVEALHAVRDRVTEMTQLCSDLMLIAHAQEGGRGLDLREIPVTSCVADGVRRVSAAAAARGISIDVHAVPDLVAYADARLFARVVDNVLSNAVHYNRDGGRVAISGRAEDADPGDWRPATVILDVSDTGSGIPPEAIERVFERFYRVDPSRTRDTGGTGLGLAICREVLGVLGGSIRVADSSPAGTTFEIRIPGRAAARQPTPVA